MGGRAKKVHSWLVQKPLRTGGLAALLTIPYSVYTILTSDTSMSIDDPEFISFAAKTLSPMFAFSGCGITAELLKTFTHEDKYNPRTRIGDFKKRRWLKSNLKQRNFEQLIDEEFELQKQSSVKAFFSRGSSSVPDTEKGADTVAALAEQNKDPKLFADAVFRYFKHNKYDDAFIQLNKLFQLGAAPPSISWPSIAIDSIINKWDRFLNPRNPSGLIYASMLSALRQNYAQALYYSAFARKTAEFFSSPVKKEIFCLDALIHHTLQAKDSEQVWSRCIAEIQHEPILERISETANPVRIITASQFLSKTLVFKESKDKEALEAEADMTNYIARVLPDNLSTAEPLHITDTAVNGSYTYVMRHASGETLLEKFKKKSYSALFSVAKILALIHAKVPKRKVRKGVLNIALKVKRKLVSPDILLPREIISKIVHNYRPVFNALNDTNCVYNKDAHPENWLVHEKGIVVLDCENGFLVPQQFDLVNLLEYSHYLTDAQKDRAIEDYTLMYESHTNTPIDRGKFKLAYFNAVIHRAISLCTAWSSRARPSMHSERQHVIFNAICAIDKIKKEHSRYHAKYRSYYLNLKTSLEKIHELVSVKGDS